MTKVDEVGVPSLAEVMANVIPFSENLKAFLQGCKDIEPETELDIVGLGFVLKGAIRFQDILVLVERHRFIGAEALLRGLWESRMIFRYLMKCSSDPQKAAEAYGTYMDFYFAEKGRKVKTIMTIQTPEIQAKFAAYEQAFRNLPADWQSFCNVSSNTKDVCLHLDRKSPLPKLIDGTQPSHEDEYYMIFGHYSNSAHGSLSDAQRYFVALEDGLFPSEEHIDEMSRVIPSMAYLWMEEILRVWAESIDSSPYLPLFHKHFAPELQQQYLLS